MPSLDLRFPLKAVGYFRRDHRLSSEIEQPDLPAVEIVPLADGGADFADQADRLWMILRVPLAFRFRQAITTVAEKREGILTVSSFDDEQTAPD